MLPAGGVTDPYAPVFIVRKGAQIVGRLSLFRCKAGGGHHRLAVRIQNLHLELFLILKALYKFPGGIIKIRDIGRHPHLLQKRIQRIQTGGKGILDAFIIIGAESQNKRHAENQQDRNDRRQAVHHPPPGDASFSHGASSFPPENGFPVFPFAAVLNQDDNDVLPLSL